MQKDTKGGLGLSSVLFIVFLILKLTGLIAWSWWWVTAPLWIPVVVILICIIIVLFHADQFKSE